MKRMLCAGVLWGDVSYEFMGFSFDEVREFISALHAEYEARQHVAA